MSRRLLAAWRPTCRVKQYAGLLKPAERDGGQGLRVHILDDYFDTLRGLPSFARLAGHEVTVWTDRVEDPTALAERLSDAEALVLFRERTRVSADLVDRLPKLRLVSQRSGYPHIDVKALTRNGVLLCSNTKPESP